MSAISEKVRIRADITAMQAYTPTSSLEVFAEELGFLVGELIKLDANENPYGPSPYAINALNNLRDTISIYPDPQSSKLRKLLSDYVGVSANNILVGAGADELLELIMQLFIEPGDTIINCPPTFGMYGFNAPLFHANVINVPRKSDFSLDVEGIEKAARENEVKLLFLCSPNNPDGSMIPQETINRLLDLPLVVVLDEAYIEFSGIDGMAKRVPKISNLIVLRTFSKWAGLAGLRVGYGIFPGDLMPHLWKIKQPYNVNVAADAAARASLTDWPFLQANIKRIIAERERLGTKLGKLSFLIPYPTHSNFVLCQIEGMPALELKTQLAQKGILIRYFNKPGLTDHIRISVGTPAQTDILLIALQEIGEDYD
jgi:histidinol-phosphate aminotransferase